MVETAAERAEAVVVVEVEVSGTWMHMGLGSLPAWSFRACLGGSLWPLVWQGGQEQEWLSWVSRLCCCWLEEKPVFSMRPGTSGH